MYLPDGFARPCSLIAAMVVNCLQPPAGRCPAIVTVIRVAPEGAAVGGRGAGVVKSRSPDQTGAPPDVTTLLNLLAFFLSSCMSSLLTSCSRGPTSRLEDIDSLERRSNVSLTR